MSDHLDPGNLLYTKRGLKWLAQFKLEEQEVARKIVDSLTLVSHSEFERSIQAILEREVAEKKGPVAFFVIREVDPDQSYFDVYTNPITGKIDALPPGSDYGSEARIATLVRNYCKTDSGNLLNHPTIGQMRASKCRTIVLMDDFIGSGDRAEIFIKSFWRDPSIASWHSLKYIRMVVVAYSGTAYGIRRVKRHKAGAEVIIERSCPTFVEMPWRKKQINEVTALCEKYGSKTSKGYWWDGYGRAMAALVFEHGCPDNAPVILWAPSEPAKPWRPLFPNRVILAGEKSVFPPEIARRDSKTTLLDVGQKRLALGGSLSRRGEMGELILLILAMIAQGQRKQIALSFATGLSERACIRIIDNCVKWGFITHSRRLTAKGLAELRAAKKSERLNSDVPESGDEYYYPKRLRGTTHG